MQFPGVETNGAAIFIDIENVIGHCASLGIPFYVKAVCDKIKEIAPIRFRTAFGDIPKSMLETFQRDKITSLRKDLAENLVDIQDIPYRGYKNSADIQIVTTAISMAYENPHVTHFVFVTNDIDYVQLYKKLKSIGKRIVVVSMSESITSNVIVEAVDQLFYYDKMEAIANILAPAAKVPSDADTQGDDEGVDVQALMQEYADLIIRSSEILQNEGKPVTLANLNEKAKSLRSDFDPMNIGYKKFNDFIKDLEQKEIFALVKNGTGDVKIEVQEAKATPAKATKSKTKAAPAKEIDNETLLKTYKEAMETKLKIPFPSYECRKNLVDTIATVIKSNPKLSLNKLSDTVRECFRERYPNFPSFATGTAYKILLTLIYSRSFNIQREMEFNDTVILDEHVNPDVLFEKLSNHYASALLRNSACQPLKPEALSLLIYENMDPANVEKCVGFIDDAKEHFKRPQYTT